MTARAPAPSGRPAAARVFALLALALTTAIVLAIAIGAIALVPWRLDERQAAILFQLRLPRVVLAVAVGAALATSGAALQGAVRNPLADPGIVGVASGAALGAVAYLVLGERLATAWPALAPYLVALAAFAGALVTTSIVMGAAAGRAQRSATGVVLAGVAVASLASAGTGLLITIANDAQLRSITFWSLGSLAAASWTLVAAVLPPVLLSIAILWSTAGALDRLLLGDPEARHLGLDVPRARRRVIGAVALGVGASVAACGAIGFVGLIVPHLVRGWLGPGHRLLLPASALAGALLLTCADLAARTAAAPTELPIGILTALAGAPVLLAMVRGGREVVS